MKNPILFGYSRHHHILTQQCNCVNLWHYTQIYQRMLPKLEKSKALFHLILWHNLS